MSAKIEDLEPVTRDLCIKWLSEVERLGYKVRIVHTLRTMEEQAKLYAQGRQLPGPQVTKAKPGQSPHNFGMAFDFCFEGKTLKECYPVETDPRWKELGQLGESLGLSWGGPNGKGDKFTFDRPHFQRLDWRKASAKP